MLLFFSPSLDLGLLFAQGGSVDGGFDELCEFILSLASSSSIRFFCLAITVSRSANWLLRHFTSSSKAANRFKSSSSTNQVDHSQIHLSIHCPVPPLQALYGTGISYSGLYDCLPFRQLKRWMNALSDKTGGVNAYTLLMQSPTMDSTYSRTEIGFAFAICAPE